MRVTGKKTIFEGRHLRIVEKALISDDGVDRAWETLERTNVYGNGAVVIIPLTRDGNLILEKNWRAPIESCVIQFPAGLTDIDGESEEEAARRELLEETGYMAKKLIPVFLSPLSAALTGTRAMHFFAPDVEFKGKPAGDGIEQIEVLEVPLDKADDFMLNLPEGVELDLRVPGILWMLKQKGLLESVQD
ncbi:MAG: NUDIX hydrolase [Dehalococcoidia bacterium]|nr:NUDIX hydrolase [Dehalococcoidia bacterium]